MSACHAVHPSPEHPQGDPAGPGCYTTLFKEWLNKRLPLVSVFDALLHSGLIRVGRGRGTYHHERRDRRNGFKVSLCFDVRLAVLIIYHSYYAFCGVRRLIACEKIQC